MKSKRSFFWGLVIFAALCPGCEEEEECLPLIHTAKGTLWVTVFDDNAGQPVPNAEVHFSSYIEDCETDNPIDREYITKRTDASGMVGYSRVFGFTYARENGIIRYNTGENCRGHYFVSGERFYSSDCIIDELE